MVGDPVEAHWLVLRREESERHVHRPLAWRLVGSGELAAPGTARFQTVGYRGLVYGGGNHDQASLPVLGSRIDKTKAGPVEEIRITGRDRRVSFVR